MAKVSLILADRDDFFAEKFSRYILEHNNFYEITAFTQQNYLLDYIKNNSVDVLLTDKSFITDEVKEYINKGLIVVLDESDGEYNGYPTVNKYQKTENIIKEITFRYAESIGDKSIISSDSKKAKIVSVYSPAGGSGKSVISGVLSVLLAQNGFSPVYLNMEKFNSGLFGDFENTEGLSDIFLKMKNKSKNLSFEITKRIISDENGVKMFAPTQSGMEFDEMSEDEITEFVSELAGIDNVSHIIVDLPTEFDRKTMNMLKLSNNILFIAVNDPIGYKKLKNFINEINIFPELRVAYEKIIPMINKNNSRGIPESIAGLMPEKPIVTSVPFINGIDRYGRITDITGVIGNYVTDVLRQISGR